MQGKDRTFRLLSTTLIAAALAVALGLIGSAFGHGGGGAEPPAGRAQAAVPAGAAEVAGLRTERSRTWRLQDGRLMTRSYAVPVNVRDGKGRWLRLDAKLGASAAGGFVPERVGYGLRLPERSGGEVRLRDGDRSLSFRLRESDAAGTVDGAVATYPEARPGVTLRWTATRTAVKEELVLASSEATREFTFDVAVSAGLALRERARGVEAVDGREVAFAFAPPFAVDAAGERAPEEAVSLDVVDGSRLVLRVDDAWLRAPERRFPVTVDPTVWPNPADDCMLDAEQTGAGYGYCADGYLWAGMADFGGPAGVHDHRPILRFDLSGVPQSAQVLDAGLNLYARTDLGDPSAVESITAHRVTEAWDPSQVSWNERTATQAWSTAGGDFEATAADTVAMAAVQDWYRWDVAKMTRQWIEGDAENRGVLLNATTSSPHRAMAFEMSEGDPNAIPYLEIYYWDRIGARGDYTLDSQPLTDRAGLAVNVANGNLLMSSRDLEVNGRGLDVSIGRVFNSLDPWDGELGYGTRFTVGKDIAMHDLDSGDRLVIGPGGDRFVFDKQPDGSYKTPPGANANLVRESDGTWTLTEQRSGVKTRFFDHEYSFMTEQQDRNGNTISFSYDSCGLSQIDDTQGRQIQVTTNADCDITRVEDPTGRAWQYAYRPGRLLASVTDPEGKVTAYDYDTDGRLEVITDPRGAETTIGYDAENRVSSVTRKGDPATTADDQTTTYAYSGATGCPSPGPGEKPAAGKTVITDPLSRQTTHCWNAKGQVVHVTDALGNERKGSYTPNGDSASFTGFAGTANPATTTLSYASDDTNNLTGGELPAGESFQLDYRTASSSDPLQQYRPERYEDTQGQDEFYGYDAAGNLTSVKDDDTNPRNQATLAYNSDGMLVSATDGEGNPAGSPGSAHKWTYEYFTGSSGINDFQGNLKKITPPTTTGAGAALGTTELTYDALSRVKTVTDGRGQTRTMTYDTLDRLTRIDVSDGAWMTFAYDANGNITQRQDSSSNTTSYTTDRLNRRTYESFPGGRSNTYQYDKAGNLTTITDAAGTVTYTYDDVDRVKTIVSPTGSGSATDTVSYAYDDDVSPRTQTQTFPGGFKQRREVDLSGKLTRIDVRNSSDSVLRSLAYTYLNATKETQRIATVENEADELTAYAYTSDVGRLATARTENGSNSLVREYRYEYDKAGNRTQKQVETPSGTTTTSYAYNQANQLCWSHTAASTAGCTSPPSGATTYTHDANGNLTSGPLGYDTSFDRLTSISGTSLGYLSPNNTELTSHGTETFQNNLLGVSRLIGASTTNIVRDPDTGAPVSQRTGTSKQFFTHDQLGSTRHLLDSTGIARSYTYDPDGNASSTGSGASSQLRFAGGHLIGSRYHFGARYYDPAIARWTQQDPLDQVADLREANRYAYVGSDPVGSTDPTGTHSRTGSGGIACNIDDMVYIGESGSSYVGRAIQRECISGRFDGGNVSYLGRRARNCILGGGTGLTLGAAARRLVTGGVIGCAFSAYVGATSGD